jgi:hypothetical protein
MRRYLNHTPRITRWAETPCLARESHNEVLTTRSAPRTGESQREDSAPKELTELALYPHRHGPTVLIVLALARQPRFEMCQHGLVKHGALGPAAPVNGGLLGRSAWGLCRHG